MELVTDPKELQSYLDQVRVEGKTIGLVPTMGFLHQGHISLIERAVTENDVIITTIFVNPLQFSANEDLSTYPRNIEKDTELCLKAGTNVLFTPAVEEMFCDTVLTSISVSNLSSVLEGVSRPTHFSGVATVVSKLFNIVGPCRAYFGEKDWQQLQIIRKMVIDLSYPVEVIGCPIIRDHDGLALSSRNVYLNSEQREIASIIPQALQNAHERIRGGEKNTQPIKEIISEHILSSSQISVDYIEVVNGESLEPVIQVDEETRVLIAVRIGTTRLIDNINPHIGINPI
ncbi:MAG: pantoate--beta-alanine ligase [Acidimicrobiaceae bacterium]|nr:pantoate--beta-alanine ligase [Acidimicrobiaceae bacterium]